MIDSGSKGCPEQESAGCHFGTLGRNFLRAKTKWPPNISRSQMIFQQMKPGTSVIPHFHVILTGRSISCIILMTQGHLQGQKDNFKVKEAKIQFLTNKDRPLWYYFVDPMLASRSNVFPKSKTKSLPDISRSNIIFQQMKLGTNVIPHFHVILTGQFISCIICMIQGQKVKYQGQLSKITIFNK